MSWYEDLTDPMVKKPAIHVEAPAGFNGSHKSNRAPVVRPQGQVDEIKVKKAWDIASGPAKGIPMSLFMMYMAGNTLQMMSIMMIVSLFSGAFRGIFSVNSAFKGLETEGNRTDILMAKAMFAFFQFVVLGLGVYKLNSMGLIPNRPGDWLTWENVTNYTV